MAETKKFAESGASGKSGFRQDHESVGSKAPSAMETNSIAGELGESANHPRLVRGQGVGNGA